MKAQPARVLEWITDGETLDSIVDDSDGWKAGEVVALARENGFALNVSSKRFQRAPQPRPLATGGIVRQTPTASNDDGTETVVPLRPAHRDLIDEGKASTVTRVRNAAIKADTALQVLADLLDDTRAAEAARAEVARLEEQLRAAKAALKGGTTTGPEVIDARTVRAWAAENGVDCPTRGIVPNRVVDAYRAAVAS